MIEKLKTYGPIQLMKNGVYYLDKNGAPILNYLELIESKQHPQLFHDYISYRLDSTGRSLSRIQKKQISEAFRQKLIRFKEGIPLLEDFKSHHEWLLTPTFLLLSLGGDDRSLIDPKSFKNKYHSSTLPMYDFQRSSCTSSSISLETYLHLEQQHFELICDFIDDQIQFNDYFHNQSQEILSYFVSPSFRDRVSLISTPSGTDVEFLCTWLGVLRYFEHNQEKDKAKVSVFVNGDLEVGSGTKLATELCHFAGVVPCGEVVNKGQKVLSDKNLDIKIESFVTRDELTKVLNSKENELQLYNKVKDEIQSGRVVVFHFVHASKTGVCIPSNDLVRQIKNDFKEKVIIVVDAAQMRLKSDSVEQYLDDEMNIIVTGSKFIGGCPFSGALLVNQRDQMTFIEAKKELPKEFSQYFDQFGINHIVKRARDSALWTNWGLYLRWEVALHEMKQFDRIPLEFSNQFIVKWGEKIDHMIQADKFKVNVLRENALLPSDDSSLSNSNSIVAFEIETQIPLTLEQLKRIHAKMTLKRTRDDLVCEIGQPVQISTGNTSRYALRVALGAKNVIDAYRGTSSYKFDDCLEYLLSNDQKILNKLFDLIEEEVEFSNE
jgi:thiol-disulfide isomerase/thioredoxin